MWALWLVPQSEGFAGRQLRHIAVHILLQGRQQVLIVLRNSRLILLVDTSNVLGVSRLGNSCSIGGRTTRLL